MTGSIIPLRGEPHERIQSLLPWFVTGRLDDAERAEVEAHLKACEGCRLEERLERRIAAEVVALPLASDEGWARLRGRLARRGAESGARPRVAPGRRGPEPSASTAARPRWLGLALALQAAVLIAGVALISAWPAPRPDARYHTLGSRPMSADGNLVVMFRPQTTEPALRAALVENQARIVDGPTGTGAYVLQVPAARLPDALTNLRRRPEILLAQPLDAGAPMQTSR